MRTIIKKDAPTVWNIFEELTQIPGRKIAPLDPHSVIYRVKDFVDGSCIHLIPSRLELASSLRNPGQKEQFLSKFLSKIENEYDLILLDCAPTESVLTQAAYLASDHVLVPVKPDFLSTIGLPLLARSIKQYKQQYEDHNLEVAGIVFNNTTGYSPEEILSKNEVNDEAKRNGWYVFKAEISSSRSYAKGAREGKPIFSTSYARSSQAEVFHHFATELAERLKL